MPSKQTQDEVVDEVVEVTPRENRAEALEPGEPVEAQAVTQMGATFAERAGKKAPAAAKKANSTFADRAKGAKQVKADDVEDKSVAKKTASKKS